MKVALISYSYPNVNYDGVAFSVFNLANALSNYVDVTLFVPDINKDRLQKLEQRARLYLTEMVNIPFLRSPTFMLQVSRKLRPLDFDVIHSNGGVALFCRFVSVETFRHRPRSFREKLHASPQYLTLRRARQVIAVSQRGKQELLKMGVSEKKITVVEHGVDTHLFFHKVQGSERVKKSLGLMNNGEAIILNVSSGASARKNFPLLMRTLLFLKRNDMNIKLIIIGPRMAKRPTLSLAASMGLSQDIYYVHDIPLEEMPSYYSAADFVVVPSLQEGFGHPFLEGIAVGKPFVSLATGISQRLAAEKFGLVARGEREFMESCLKMCQNPLVVGARGHAFVQENYSWDSCARKTLEVYKKALS